MKEAIANAGVFNLIIIFVIILLAFFIGSLGYSKAFKVKNKIIEEIEKEGNYSDAKDEIEKWLSSIGYRVVKDNSWKCPLEGGNSAIKSSSKYQYCVYKFSTCDSDDKIKCGTYYRAVAYMYFDVPIISGLIKIPVKGETVVFTKFEG